MKLHQRMLTFGIVLMAAMMAFNEFPELLTLTDNVTNDYVSVRSRSESSHQIVVQESTDQLTAVPMVFNPPVQLRVAADSNFLLSPAAKSPGGLLLLLVTQRT
jgi:hypothetical protein